MTATHGFEASNKTGAAGAVASRRFAIITPYYQETVDLLRRCIESVRQQTIPIEHFMVADGNPQAWLDSESVRHVRLDHSHRDFGNTPRGIGALLAIAEEFEGIGFLDADNWLEPNHVELCVAAGLREPDCDFVIAQRHFRSLDGAIFPLLDEKDHVDTNCLFLLRGSFFAASLFASMPKELSPIGDRIFYQALKARGLKAARVEAKTVNYVCLWENAYRLAGRTPPPGAKRNVDPTPMYEWLARLSPRELQIASRLSGIDLANVRGNTKPARNAPCPCGSGLRYKQCHGRLS